MGMLTISNGFVDQFCYSSYTIRYMEGLPADNAAR